MNSGSMSHVRALWVFWQSVLLSPVCFPGIAQATEPQAIEPQAFQLVIHATNPTVTLSRSAVGKMFLGNIERWPDGREVSPIDCSASSQTRIQFSRTIHGRSVTSITSYWQRRLFSGTGTPPPLAASDREVLAFVRSRPGAIGYVSGTVRLGQGVKALEIDEAGRAALAERDDAAPQATFPTRELSGPTLLRVHPRDSETLFAALPGVQLSKSTDRGQSWNPIIEGLGSFNILDLAVHPKQSLLFAVDGEEVYRSVDGGNFWEQIWSLQAVKVEIDRRDPNILYVLTRTGFARSVDQGTNFSALQLPVPGGFSTVTANTLGGGLLAATDTALWLSDERGEAWQELSVLPMDGIIKDIAMQRATIYLATSQGVFVTTFGTRILTRLNLEQPVSAIVVTPTTLVASNSDSIFTSYDGGASWDRVVIRDATVAADPNDPDGLFAVTPSGRVSAFNDGTGVWRQIFYFFRPPPLADIAALRDSPPAKKRTVRQVPLVLACSADDEHIAALAFDPLRPSVVYAAGWQGVFKSVDYGVSWVYASQGLEISDVHALAVDPVQSSTVYAGTHGAGVFKSLDGGKTWVPSRSGLRDPVVHSLLVDPTLPSVVFAGTASGFFVSSDSGRSWRRQGEGDSESPDLSRAVSGLTTDPSDRLRRVAVSSLGELWVGDTPNLDWMPTDRKIALSQAHFEGAVPACTPKCPEPDLALDYGIDLGRLPLRSVLLHPENSESAFAATPFGVWRTGDLGASWSRLNLDANVATLVDSGRSPLKILAGAANGLWKSPAKGNEWQPMSLSDPVYSLAIDRALPSTLYAGLDSNQLGQSKDDGESWDIRSIEARPHHTDRRQAIRARERPTPGAKRVTEAALKMWEGLQATPTTDPHLRALITTELLARSPNVHEDMLRRRLVESLKFIQRAESRRVPDDALGLRFSPRQRWLMGHYGFDSCHQCNHQIRLFDLDQAMLQAVAPDSGALNWRNLHDLTLEPPHLLPRWLLSEPGRYLAWSHNDQFVATGDSGRVSVWNLGGRSTTAGGDLASPVAAEPTHWKMDATWSHCLSVDLDNSDDKDNNAAEDKPTGDDPAAEPPLYSVPEGCEVALSGDGEWFAYAAIERVPNLDPEAEDQQVAVVRIAQRRASATEVEVLWSLPVEDPEDPVGWTHLVFTPDHRYLLAFASDGSLWTFLVGSTPPEAPMVDVEEPWINVELDPTGQLLAATTQRDFWVWPLSATGWPLVASAWQSIELPVAGEKPEVVFSDDGRWIAVESSSGETQLFDLEDPLPASSKRSLPLRDDLGVFSRDSRQWIAHSHGMARVMELGPARQRIAGSSSFSPNLYRRSVWPEALETQRHKEYSRELLSQGRRWLVETQHQQHRLWDLSGHPARGLAVQIERRGPVGPETEPIDGPSAVSWPIEPLDELSTRALRDLACQAVKRNLNPREWRNLLGDEPWQPTCQL